MKTSDLVKMAKTKKSPSSTIKNTTKKTIEAKKVAKPLEEVEEDRDTKAKKTVEKLLEGISFNPLDYKKKVEEEPEYGDDGEEDGETNENNSGGTEWLEQQVTELTEINEYLRNQLAVIPQNNTKNLISDEVQLVDNNVKMNVIKLFMELQTVYMNVGFNYQTNPPRSNMIIFPEKFMARLLDFFPFLEEYRKIPLQ